MIPERSEYITSRVIDVYRDLKSIQKKRIANFILASEMFPLVLEKFFEELWDKASFTFD